MNIYKVWIQIEEIDESKDHYLNIGEPYEAGKFSTEATARKYVENELMIIRTINTKLRNACEAALKFLNSLGKTNLITMLEHLAACRKKLNEAINCKVPAVNDSCPKYGARCDEREFTGRDFLGIEAIHVHYICKKCGSKIIEEYTSRDIFIDNPHN